MQQQQTGSPKSWRSLDLEHGAASSSLVSGIRPSFRTQRSSSMPTPRSTGAAAAASKSSDLGSAVCHGYAAAAVPSDLDHSPPGPVDVKERSTRGSVSNENNILLDPEVLTDYPTQALLLTVLVRIASHLLSPTTYAFHPGLASSPSLSLPPPVPDPLPSSKHHPSYDDGGFIHSGNLLRSRCMTSSS